MTTARSHRRLTTLILTLSLAACSARRAAPAGSPPGTAHAAAGDDRSRIHTLWQQRSHGGTPGDLCLGPGDLLEISVFRWSDLQNLRTRISPAGTISLPYLG